METKERLRRRIYLCEKLGMLHAQYWHEYSLENYSRCEEIRREEELVRCELTTLEEKKRK